MISTQMKSNNAVYTIAYYCSILNSDPSYINVHYADELSGFAGANQGPFTDHDYDDFRMIFGVCMAYITAYLMHFNMEISSAMKPFERSFKFDDLAKFRCWEGRSGSQPAKWVFKTSVARDELNPEFMRYVTPFNFMYVRWNDFQDIVEEILKVWRPDCKRAWCELAVETYGRYYRRGEHLMGADMRSRMFLWKKWKGDTNILYGMARHKSDRNALETYEGIMGHPYDYLMTSITNHHMAHTDVEFDILRWCNPMAFDGNLTDVYPGSQGYHFNFPQTERGLIEYRAAENRGGGGTKRRGETLEDGERSAQKQKKKSTPAGGSGVSKGPSTTAVVPSLTSSYLGAHHQSSGWSTGSQALSQHEGDEDVGPVRRDIRQWEMIKQNLFSLTQAAMMIAQTAQQLANTVQQLEASLPTMTAWIEKSLDNRLKHSERAKSRRESSATRRVSGESRGDMLSPPARTFSEGGITEGHRRVSTERSAPREEVRLLTQGRERPERSTDRSRDLMPPPPNQRRLRVQTEFSAAHHESDARSHN